MLIVDHTKKSDKGGYGLVRTIRTQSLVISSLSHAARNWLSNIFPVC